MKNHLKYNVHEMEDAKHDVKLSILIPCYNWDVLNLIKDLYTLCTKEERLIDFEIICLEDASPNCFRNDSMSNLKNVKYEILEKNIGRSSIRNLLAQKARFEWLLFIDCDSKIATQNFIENYIKHILVKKTAISATLTTTRPTPNKNLYYGETIYEKKKTKHILHQKYGTQIESKRKKKIFSSHHFLVNKTTFSKNRFDDSIKEYGYEDVLFQIDNKNTFCFHYIKNSLYHVGLKKNGDFIKDCETGLKNLLKHVDNKQVLNKIKILGWWRVFSCVGLRIPVVLIFNIFKSPILKNLNSNNPSLFLFQFYKLGFFFQIEYNSRKNRK